MRERNPDPGSPEFNDIDELDSLAHQPPGEAPPPSDGTELLSTIACEGERDSTGEQGERDGEGRPTFTADELVAVLGTDGVLETEEDAGDATGEDEGDGQQDDEGTEDGDEDIGDSEAEADDEPDDEAREETTEQTEAGTVDASLEDLPAEKPAAAEEARELWQLQREISEWREAQGARRSLVPRKCF